MYEQKLESYKKNILDKLYSLTRKKIDRDRNWFALYNKNEFVQDAPPDDRIIIDAAWGELNYTYIEQQSFLVRFRGLGIIRYEQNYLPSVTIRYKDLLIPVLIAVFNYAKSGKKGINFDFIQDEIKKSYGYNISDNDIYAVLIILKAYNYLNISNTMSGSIVYMGMTNSGKSKAIRSLPKSPIDEAINRLSYNLLNLDYFKKDLYQCSLRLRKWLEQFKEEKEKLAALFLVEHLFIATNDGSNKKWKKFFFKNLDQIDQEDIYYLAAGGPGSSGESWRHKFIREIDLGKQQSRTLKAIKEKKTPSDWQNKVIIFIDDIIGSGDQFKNFIESNLMHHTGTELELLDQFKTAKIMYFVIIATEQGINYITQNIPIKRENINYGYLFTKFFDSSNPVWKKTTPITREECLRICKEYGKKLYFDYPLGFLDAQLLVAFQDHTPDNTLPVLWWSENDNWEPLLKR